MVRVNGQPVKASYRPLQGDCISLTLPSNEPEASAAPAQELPELDILYEDDAIVVLDKPAGLSVHVGAGSAQPTLVQLLVARYPSMLSEEWDNVERPGIVHRLDKNTSGIMVAARTRYAQKNLQAQFKAHGVEKTYLAVLHGHLQPPEGLIDAPLGRHPTVRIKRAILAEGGRPAVTRYLVLEQFEAACLVQAQPLSGRTHQLRVHFASVGHAIVGDTLYGPRRSTLQAPRQMLHSWHIRFNHPISGVRLSFEAPLADDIAALLAELRQG